MNNLHRIISMCIYLHFIFDPSISIGQYQNVGTFWVLSLEENFFDIGNDERKDVISKTGCHIPCQYREYQLLTGELKGLASGFGIVMGYPSTDVKLEEEEYIYPFLSFVSECGGALGMFLGFSFNMLWDVFVNTATWMRTRTGSTIRPKRK